MMQAHWDRRKSGEGGFTLVELLVVIAILGILAAIVTFAVTGITDRGEDSACEANVKSLETAVEAYNAENGGYPAAAGDVVPSFLRELPPAAQFNYVAATGAVTGNC